MTLASQLAAEEPASSALPDAFQADQLLWELPLGTHQYTVPRLDGNQLFIGINDTRLEHPIAKRTGGGVLMCLNPQTGQMVWQQVVPRFMEGKVAPFHFNHWKCGVCSSPAIDGKRLYIVSPRGEVLCLDRNGQADGNDGPFLEEKEYMGAPSDSDYQLAETDGDILWQFNLLKECAVVPHDVCGSSPVVHGDYVYACTSNGVDDTHRQVANKAAPSLIVLNKLTGKLAATDGELIGERLFHGQWSSPVVATIREREMILFGGGDGVLYAFEPLKAPPQDSVPRALVKIWERDCIPADYRERAGQKLEYGRWNQKSPEGPSEIIATPIVAGNRIYASIGQSPVHGPGKGALSCIDGATGQLIWQNREIERSLSDAAIDGELLYMADYTGRLHCLETESGKSVWQQDLGGGVWTSSPVVVAGKVYVSTEKQMLWIMKAGRTQEVLDRCRLRSVGITPVVHQDVLYFPTQQRLFAIRLKS